MSQPPSNPFERMQPVDGVRIVRTELGRSIYLTACVYSGGKLAPLGPPTVGDGSPEPETSRLLDRMPDADNAKAGESERLEMVLDAVARYLTTGGQWQPLLFKLRLMAEAVPGGLAFPGWHLCTSYVTTEGRYQHIFVKTGTHEAVLWEEPDRGDNGLPTGGFIDVTTLEQLREQDELEANFDVQQALEAAEAEAEQGET